MRLFLRGITSFTILTKANTSKVMTKSSTLTPMMQQYMDIRKELPTNTLLFFRLGDFYELFFEDAEDASKILGITLTKRHDTPMAGIPFHAAENYINKLLQAGKKVGICDQVGTPQTGKLVKRELTRILTPGTTLEESQVSDRENQYLLAIDCSKTEIHAAWMDISTGEFVIASDSNLDNLLSVFTSINPKEIIVPELGYRHWQEKEKFANTWENLKYFLAKRPISERPDFIFDPINGAREVMESLGVLNLDGFGIDKQHPALGAANAVIAYVTENLCGKPQNLTTIREYRSQNALLIDPATQRNLEIFKSADNTKRGSLFGAIDRTVTSAGSRLLENYLAAPLLDIEELRRRHQCIEELITEQTTLEQTQKKLSSIRDIRRILGRLQNKIRNPRELGGIRDTLDALPELINILLDVRGKAFPKLLTCIHTCEELKALLNAALNEELPGKLQEGGVIKRGFDEQLDHCLDLMRNNKHWLASLEQEEQKKTGIKNLKIKFNGPFGYFIEISKSNLHLVPEHYVRKQTMTNAERFFTEELKVKEKEILGAESASIAREEELFQGLVDNVLEQAQKLQETAEALAQIDVFVGWAKLALEWDYCKPSIDNGDALEIDHGRHPVVEQMLNEDQIGLAGSHSFVPNDTWLKSSNEQIALITGPNMAGKSTYIRQVALITLMGQIGCWVPAKKCHIGLVDRIFSRVGASDELARGNSTFMVEMNETANILNNATDKSLIILDEIGRGTSTYDGLSIAWAVIEHIHGENKRGPRTLFATHYHEVTKLEEYLPRLRNFSVSVKEWNDQIIFVRQVIPGAADRSYGIQVARLAGLPISVINRAKTILDELENAGNTVNEHLETNTKRTNRKANSEPAAQLCLF